MLYDFQTGHWTELTRAEASLGVPFWSHDGRDIFFQRVIGSDARPIYRLNIVTRAFTEQVRAGPRGPALRNRINSPGGARADVGRRPRTRGSAPQESPISGRTRSHLS
jgi:hypothetical protein